ncbi:MAG: hypothetical protein HZA01_11415 [Nitrospinae bacterium]|nr:hypothetical protein [Nitrospinota bacterium]
MERHSWIFVLAFAAVFFGSTQFSTPNLIAYDGHFHIKYAWLMRTEGLILHKDLLPFTILKGEFLDHHFLYHLLLMPFTFLDLRIAGKAAPVVFASFMVLAFYEAARRQKVPWPMFWVLVLLSSSFPFLYRMSVARVMNVTLALQIVLFVLLTRERNRLVFLCGFLYAWLHYSASFVAPLLALLYVLAVFLAEQKFRPAPLGYAFGGAAAGFIINPFFPENMIFSAAANLHKLLYKSTVEVGNEWYGYKSEFFLDSCALVFIAFFLGLLLTALSEKKIRSDVLFSFFISALYAAASMKARRYVEYWPPFVLLFCGMAARDFFADGGSPGLLHWLRRWKAPLMAGLFLTVGFFFFSTTKNLAHDLRHTDSNETDRYGPAARWLAAHTTEGETVFNAEWDAFPEYFFHNSKNSLVAGMDPAFMEMEDPLRSKKYGEIAKGKIDNPSALIYSLFKTRYILAHNRTSRDFIKKLAVDKGARKVFSDDVCSVFEIKEGRNTSQDE